MAMKLVEPKLEKKLNSLTDKICRVADGAQPSELAAVCSRLIGALIFKSTPDIPTQNARLDALIEFIRDDLARYNNRLH